MQKAEIVQLLSTVSFFKALSKKDLEEISQFVTHKTFAAGKVFIEEGVEGFEAYVILSGLTKVYRITDEGKEVHLALRTPGETVGEFALLDDLPRSAYVKTLQKTELLVIPKKEFISIIHRSPTVAMGIIRMLSYRIRENTLILENALFQQLPERVLLLLKEIARFFPNKEVTLSQEDIATILGATRPRVTEALHALQKKNVLKIAHKKIIVL